MSKHKAPSYDHTSKGELIVNVVNGENLVVKGAMISPALWQRSSQKCNVIDYIRGDNHIFMIAQALHSSAYHSARSIDLISSDPYVRIGWPSRLDKHYFLEQFIKSHHIDNSLNPEWYFQTTWQLPHEDQGNKPEENIKVEIWDYDKASAHDFMGECYIKLSAERLTGAAQKPWILNIPLEPRPGHKDKVRGTIKVTLKFIPEGIEREEPEPL